MAAEWADGKAPSHGELIGVTAQRNGGRGPYERRAMGEDILARRNQGQTIYTISQSLGVSEQTVYRCMRLALAARIAPTVDEFRRQQNDRLDQTQREIEENTRAANEMARHALLDPLAPKIGLLQTSIDLRTKQIALQLRLDERRAKLNGLDAPIKVDATVTPVDPFDAEMSEMIRRAKAEKAAEETQTDA